MSKWIAVVVLVMLVLTGAMGLRNIVSANAGTITVSNGGAPLPPNVWSNGGAPLPPNVWSNGGAPLPPNVRARVR
jgi:hypothetical protein